MQAVKDYYGGFGEKEWLRLQTSNDGYVEYALTCRQIASCLKPHSTILDLGCGPGRYSLWLAEQGHNVVLADVSPEMLEIAKVKIKDSPYRNRIIEICTIDARDLSYWARESFDAVLCLGPYYHLPDHNDRIQVTNEIHRVLKPHGILFAAFMSRLSLVRRTLAVTDEQKHFLDQNWMKKLLDAGEFHNTIPGRFTHGFGAIPCEITSHFSNLGFKQLSLMATESIAGGIAHNLAELRNTNHQLHDTIMDILFKVAEDPSILGYYGHLLFTGVKSID